MGENFRRHQCQAVVVRRGTVGQVCRVVVHVEYQFSDVLPCDSNVAVRHHQNSVTISRRPQGDLVDGVSRQSVQRKRVECRQETRTGNTAVGYRRTGRKMLRRRGPRRNHRIGKSEDPSDPSDDHAYSPPMIQYSPKSNALVHWRQLCRLIAIVASHICTHYVLW